MRITVFAGSSRRAAPAHLEVARSLGAEIARRGHELIYGGGRTGSMGALADGALAAGGTVRGVILARFIDEDVHHLGVEMFSARTCAAARQASTSAPTLSSRFPAGSAPSRS